MKSKTLGIILGIIFATAIVFISISVTFFIIYQYKPDFLCDLCKNQSNTIYRIVI